MSWFNKATVERARLLARPVDADADEDEDDEKDDADDDELADRYLAAASLLIILLPSQPHGQRLLQLVPEQVDMHVQSLLLPLRSAATVLDDDDAAADDDDTPADRCMAALSAASAVVAAD